MSERTPADAPRWSARDLLAPTAFFLGALLIAAAVAMGPMIGSGLQKVPLSIDQTSVADGSDGSTVLDRCSLDAPAATVLEAHLQQRRRVVAVRPADSDVVTLQAGTALGVDSYLVDGKRVDADKVCKEETLTAIIDRVTLDRRTAEPHGLSSVQYDDARAAVPVPDRRGRTYVFPFGFDAAGDYFDPVTRQTLPLQNTGESQVDGRTVARLRTLVPDTDLGALGTDPRGVIVRPASWFGRFPGVAPTTELTASLHHRATVDLFVDTATGVIVDQRVEIHEEYRFTDQTARSDRSLVDYRLTNLNTVLTGDRRTRTDGADAARSRARPVRWTTVIGPIGLGVLGVSVLVGGVIVVRRSTAG
ncbi:DUF3068 domain-containing protein [Gordonia phthalatica]|uniref:DUF3068 domain-containing protein n=1 Tax=Gordonia phthalatica TaxID=1136941 RepID=A0A0N9NGI1_9ACTN|nr:DUF3068 domain-containing protein [Gordonia phthalatica]ALG86226.1 hypothetical protein ACH46_19180 [Gordonia phthalatica]